MCIVTLALKFLEIELYYMALLITLEYLFNQVSILETYILHMFGFKID